jgi:hypothetical protein
MTPQNGPGCKDLNAPQCYVTRTDIHTVLCYIKEEFNAVTDYSI